jgi:hypothetical protein
MKIFTQQKIQLILLGTVFAFLLTACSDKEKPNEQAVNAQATVTGEKIISKDSPYDATPEAEQTQKQKFEHDFAAQCADRELNNSNNKTSDAERINKSCSCIAAYIAKDLTDEEAEKFLGEHENPQSIRIKFEAAAYECLQEKAQPTGAKLFGKQ